MLLYLILAILPVLWIFRYRYTDHLTRTPNKKIMPFVICHDMHAGSCLLPSLWSLPDWGSSCPSASCHGLGSQASMCTS